MMPLKNNRPIFFFVSVLFLLSCGTKPFYEQVQKINSAGWNYDDVMRFNFEIKDTTALYDLSLSVQHTNDYPFSNIWLKTITIIPDETKKEAGLELILAETDGQWKGKGMGHTKSFLTPIQQKFHFAKPGKYEIQVIQNMRTNPLPAIQSIGLLLDKR